MFYISLPFFYENQKFNNFFKKYIKNNPDKLIAPFDIDFVHGSFPWCYWNGSINNNKGKILLLSDLSNIIDSSLIPINIDLSNLFLKDKDFFDTYGTIISSMLYNCEISNFNLLQFISQYININMVFSISNKIQFFNNFTIEDIEDIISQDFISFFITDNTDIDFKNKNKIRISIDNCSLCKNKQQCIINENISIYNFSQNIVFNNCNQCNNNNNNYYELILPFIQKGYQYFKIDAKNDNLNELNESIVKSFIKPEYIGDCFYEYQQQ